MKTNLKFKDEGMAAKAIEPRWYVVRTKNGQERWAKFNLEKQGFETYLPMRLVQRTAHGRTETRGEPLFPNIMFVLVEPRPELWRPIFSTLGVKSLICSGDHPAALKPGLIEAMRAREVNGLITISPAVKPVAPCPHAKGDGVKVKKGPFAGFDAVFSERVDANRVSILLKVLGGDTRVELHLGDIDPA